MEHLPQRLLTPVSLLNLPAPIPFPPSTCLTHLLHVRHRKRVLVVLQREVQHRVCERTGHDEAGRERDGHELRDVAQRALRLVLVGQRLALDRVLSALLVRVNCARYLRMRGGSGMLLTRTDQQHQALVCV